MYVRMKVFELCIQKGINIWIKFTTSGCPGQRQDGWENIRKAIHLDVYKHSTTLLLAFTTSEWVSEWVCVPVWWLWVDAKWSCCLETNVPDESHTPHAYINFVWPQAHMHTCTYICCMAPKFQGTSVFRGLFSNLNNGYMLQIFPVGICQEPTIYC